MENDRAQGVHHVGITVSNMEQAIAVYCEAFGLRVTADRLYTEDFVKEIVNVPGTEAIRIAQLQSPDEAVGVELLEYQPSGLADVKPGAVDPSVPGTGHVCFAVADASAAYERLKAAGFRMRSAGPVDIGEGSTRGARCFYAADSDGYVIECFEESAASEGVGGVADRAVGAGGFSAAASQAEWRRVWGRDVPSGDIAQDVLFENSQIKAWHLELEPGATSVLHTHMNPYFAVILGSSRIEATFVDGTSSVAEDRVGDVVWFGLEDDKRTHTITNLGNETHVARVIELL